MESFKNTSHIFILFAFFFFLGCQTKKARDKDEKGGVKSISSLDTTYQNSKNTDEIVDVLPITCMDWIGYYSKETKRLDSLKLKKEFIVKTEGYDKYGSANRLEGAYVLNNSNLNIDEIGNIAKYLAYQLCFSDNKRYNGVVMDCQKRKVQVVIARSERNYNDEAWAVVYNIYPANKKGELIVLDYIK